MRSCYVIRIGKWSGAIADLCEASECGFKGWLITRINVPTEHRGQGHARALLGQILAAADEEGTDLFLEIMSSGGLTYDQLEAWYRRNGFLPYRDFWRRLCRDR